MLSTRPRTLGARLESLWGSGAFTAFALTLAAAVALVVIAITISTAAPTPQLERFEEWASTEVPPAKSLTILAPRLGNPLANVSLAKVAADGRGRQVEQPIPVSLVPSGEAGFDIWQRLELWPVTGPTLLAHDGEYRLRLAYNSLTPSLPFPRLDTVTQEYVFKTATSPRPVVPDGSIQLRYGEPLKVLWNVPLEEFRVETVPPAAVEVWLDPQDRRVGYVALADPVPGTPYQVRVHEARAANGAPLLSPATLSVVTPAAPRPVADSARLEAGTRVALVWDQPLASFTYTVSPGVASAPTIDQANPRLTYIVLEQPKQAQKYEVTVTGAVALSGAPMVGGPTSFTVTTPKALGVTKLSPRGTEIGVKRESAINVTFSEAIADRAAAEAGFSLTPALSGRFEWPAPDRLRFVPDRPLPALTKISVRLAEGPKGVGGASGAYFAEPYEYSFTTQPDKLIDVNLSRQQITLIEGGKAVYTAPVATGVRGAETPTGQFLVTLKWPTIRMRGTNPSGISYDIPNVPWVMSFLGDYTFHGAPWRNQFGTPLSNGCVSMETSVAKHVYDWTPLGTPVRIHY